MIYHNFSIGIIQLVDVVRTGLEDGDAVAGTALHCTVVGLEHKVGTGKLVTEDIASKSWTEIN